MSRSIDEAISECEREAHVRIRCYDRWIQEGKVSRVDAWDRLERLLSAIKHLRKLQDALNTENATSSDTATLPEDSAEPIAPDFQGMHAAVERAVKTAS